MSIKAILLPLSTGEGMAEVVDVALGVARRFGAHVTGLHVRGDSRELLPYATLGLAHSMTQSIIDASERTAREVAARARKVFEGRCSVAKLPILDTARVEAGASASWHEEVGRESTAVALHGRLADLIVIDRPTTESPAPATLESALMATGRPVLLIPPQPAERVGDTVAIAWNGSPQAARAVSAAMPFLTEAGKVLVLSTPERADSKLDANDLARYLVWHGINAECHTFESGSRVGRTLLAKAEEFGADLLVMGAYSHSRERELVLGGVTRRVFSSAEIPVFMVH